MSSTILRLVTGREVRTKVGSPTGAAQVPVAPNAGYVQLGGRVSPADRENGAGRWDTVAGSEFVDDRIRLLE